MKRKKFIFGKNRRGVYLSKADLELLFYIHDHKLVTLNQCKIFDSIQSRSKPDITRGKLNRWSKYSVVTPSYYRLGQKGFNLTYYQISRNGINILESEGFIERYEEGNKPFVPTKNLEHWFGIQDIVVNIEKRLVKEGIVHSSYHSLEKPFLDNELVQPTPLIIPDWVISTETGFLNIELDTGTEVYPKIKEKVKKYSKLATQNKNKQYFVLLAAMDDFIPYRKEYGMDKSKRIAGMREAIIRTPGWNQHNLHFYVTSSRRASEIGYKILSGIYPYSERERKSETEMAMASWKTLHKSYHFTDLLSITPFEKDTYYPNYVEKDLYADAHYLFPEKESQEREHFAFLTIEEGSVKAWDRLRYLNLLAREMKFKQKVDKIICLYFDEEEFVTDVISERFEHVLFAYNSLWIKERATPLKFFQVDIPYKKEMIQFGRD